jgi:hypothetical protein
MSSKERILKDKSVLCIKSIMDLIRDGKLSTLTKLPRRDPRDLTVNTDSTSIDHSTLDQDCHSRESLNAMVQTMSGSRDGEQTPLLNNGTSMRSQRLSRITTGRATHLTSNQMVDLQTSDALLPTQDGGKCSDIKEPKS